jgi:hypothetical protein
LNDVTAQLVFCENGSSVHTVIVNGQIVVETGALTLVDEQEVRKLALKSRERLDPSIQREMAAAKSMEPLLSEMYFRVFENPDS